MTKEISYSDWKGDTGPGAQLKEMIRQDREARMATSTVQAATKQIPPEVVNVLKQGTWEDGGFKMPPMSRALYEKTAKVLKGLGGQWNRKAQATIFEDVDAETAIREACESGVYVDLKQAYQFFETPADVADMLVEELDLGFNRVVLEPSAGNGALILAVARACDGVNADVVEVVAIELDPKRAAKLENLSGSEAQVLSKVFEGDFLKMFPETVGEFDRVIMNPPFTRSQDIDHVRHAYDYLFRGGRLVAVMSPGWTFRSDRKAKEFREWMDEVGGTWSFLPDGSFTSSGTNVRTVMVVIDK